jgi:D-alanyl-D-alanine-carboxypeptidase/D-alanyl-D-alanine-endopeptidase
MSPSSRGRPWRRPTIVALAGCLVVGALAGCTDGGRDGDDAAPTPGTYPDVSLDDIDDQVLDRVVDLSLEGATLLVDVGGDRLHETTVGAVVPVSSVPLAETGWWIAAATLMSLAEDGLVGLDAPVADHLSWMVDDKAAITLRQLLSHTSGLPRGVDCETVAECDVAIGRADLDDDPGTAFAVSPAGFHVAARLAEVVTGRSWADVAAERILVPSGMAATSFRAPPRSEDDPAALPPSIDVAPGLLAADGTTTAEDLGRFLAMVRARGVAPGGGQVLDASSLEEMERDQSPALDTSDEPWVAATGVPTYGLGVWRNRPRGDESGLASMVSAPNQLGVFPYVDHRDDVWAVLVVVDVRAEPLDAVTDSSRTGAVLLPAAARRAAQEARSTTSTAPTTVVAVPQ